jgi:hypothetical protein
MIIRIVLCRRSTDLSWDGEEPSATAGEEDRLTGVEEFAPLPQTEAVMEATPQETIMVEGTCTLPMLAALHSVCSHRF